MLGIDVSNNNDGAFDDTAQFAIIKATEGTSFVDKLFPQYVARCVDLRIPWGGYHFAHPDVNAAADEAGHFLGRDVGSLPAVDIEPRQNANPLTIMGAPRLAAWITTWCNIVYARTSIYPFVYMPRSYATALLPYLDPSYPLWLATLDYAKPTVWKGREVAIVQYAIEGGIDRNESFVPLGPHPTPIDQGSENMQTIVQGDASAEWYITDWLYARHIQDLDEFNEIVLTLTKDGGKLSYNHPEGAAAGPIVVPQHIIDRIPKVPLEGVAEAPTSNIHLTGTVDLHTA